MKGFTEILVSSVVGLGAILIVNQLNSQLSAQRGVDRSNIDSAVAITGGWPKPSPPRSAFEKRLGQPVTVAAIDTGCDIHHPDLTEWIWNNAGESGWDDNGRDKSSNGIDDDDNGFVDDVHGWDFVSNSPALMDEHGHGTHVAGIIGAKAGSDTPMSLMILKYYDTVGDGELNMEASVRAIRYAVRMGARIINYSGGGLQRNQREEEALREAEAQGVLVVAAAGNEGANSDFVPFYPASYDLPNIVSVTATDDEGRLLRTSNFGRVSVDVAAPGKNILSALPNARHGFMTGTSQATAQITAAAAVLMSRAATWPRPESLIEQMQQSGRRLASLEGKTSQGNFVNLEKPFAALKVSKGETDQGASLQVLSWF